MVETILSIGLFVAACILPFYAIGMVVNCVLECKAANRHLKTSRWLEEAIWVQHGRLNDLEKRIKVMEGDKPSTPRLVSLKPTKYEGKPAGVHTKGGAK